MTAYSALNKIPKISNDEFIVVIGAGGVGTNGILLSQYIHDAQIIAVDTDAIKRDSALTNGAKYSFSPEEMSEKFNYFNGKIAGVVDFVGNEKTANLALSIVKDLLEDGTVLHSFLGILGSQNFETAEDGARIFAGVKIEELYGPANDVYAIGKAGALPGDVIKSLDGTRIKTLDQLITLLRARRAGEKVTIEILRDNEEIELIFELDLRPSDI